jgi:hypothetical protein
MKLPLCLLVILIVLVPSAGAREGRDNALGIDPTRVLQIREMVEATGADAKWLGRIERSLGLLSISHDFRVGSVTSGPVPADTEGLRGRPYWRHIHLAGHTESKNGPRGGPYTRIYAYHIEDLVLEVVKPASEEPVSRTFLATAMRSGAVVDEVVRFKYDLVVAFDGDTGDGVSHRIILPMTVTVRGEMVPGRCGGIGRELALTEASYGPLHLEIVGSDQPDTGH